MILIKSLSTVLIAISLCLANINGKVVDTGGAGITGAIVTLEKTGPSDTTGSDGSFSLPVGMTGFSHRTPQTVQPGMLSAEIRNGRLWVKGEVYSEADVALFDVHGRTLISEHLKNGAGIHSIALPNRGSGIYVCRIKSIKNEYLVKGFSCDAIRSGGTKCFPASASIPLAKQATLGGVFNDVISVTKAGYLHYRVIARNPDTNGVEMVMMESAGVVTDIDENEYQTVMVGNQEWTVENLRVTSLNDGTALVLDTSGASWASAGTAQYCFYMNTNNADSIRKFGALYNWNAINSGTLAPEGWHVPTRVDWTDLETFLIADGYNWDGTMTGNKIAQSMSAMADWGASSTPGDVGNDPAMNNKSGFSALPGGFRNYTGDFSTPGLYCNWWNATEYDSSVAYGRSLSRSGADLFEGGYNKKCGFSVRLLRNVKPKFTIVPVVNIQTLGSITPGTPQLVDSGSASPLFVFLPKSGCVFDFLTLGGVRIPDVGAPDTAYTIMHVAKNDTLKAWFANNDTGGMTDAEGNVYKTIKIGTQVWMAENLRTTIYNDGSVIPLITDNAEWTNRTTPAYCFYSNMTDADSIKKYGALYNWYAVTATRFAPPGWHVPTDAEWTTLQNYVIANGFNFDGTSTGNKIAKSLASKTSWQASSTRGAVGNDQTQNNQTGFSAESAGSRYFGNGSFASAGRYASWWSTTERVAANPWYYQLYYDGNTLIRDSYSASLGYSVRLVKD